MTAPTFSAGPRPPAATPLYGALLAEKIAELSEDEGFTLVFVHRDAEQAGLRARQEEILSVHGHRHIVPVVPVRETEAWALAQLWGDEACRAW